MATLLCAVAAGWLALFTPAPDAQQGVDKEAWVVKLTGLRDHMHTAFGVGPDLTLLEPEEGLEIVKEAWPKIKEKQVKTGLLKTFAFSKALPKKHAKVLEVLDIGMKDEDPDVRKYAASYVGRVFGKGLQRRCRRLQGLVRCQQQEGSGSAARGGSKDWRRCESDSGRCCEESQEAG